LECRLPPPAACDVHDLVAAALARQFTPNEAVTENLGPHAPELWNALASFAFYLRCNFEESFMTYREPEHREVREVHTIRDSGDGMSGGAMALIAVAVAAVLGFMAWALTGGPQNTASTNAPPAIERKAPTPMPPATTGQGERPAPAPQAK
jgi:hypothetical protein